MEIPLSHGKVALVDEEDYDLISQYHWFPWQNSKSRSNDWYAVANARIDGKAKSIKMHRLILDFPPYRIDHIDRNGLNNQKENLRRATQQQNTFNQSGSRNGTSKYKGVSIDRRTGRWAAQIMVSRHQNFLGRFTDEKEAAAAYNRAALLYFGEFAFLNDLN